MFYMVGLFISTRKQCSDVVGANYWLEGECDRAGVLRG